MNGNSTNTWVVSSDADQPVTDLQPLRNETETYFDFECELESPGSPVDECDYLRLIETSSNTPHNSATELSCECEQKSSHENDCPYAETDIERDKLAAADVPDYVNGLMLNSEKPLTNGHKQEESEKNVCEQQSNQISKVECNITVNPHEEFSIQNQVLNELQKQSEELSKTQGEESLQEDTSTTNDNAESVEEDKKEEVISIEVAENEEKSQKDETENQENNSESTKTENSQSAAESQSAEQTSESKKTTHSHMDTTDDEDDCRPQRVRRCSSLKTGKTPPGTPGRKKIVRFADVLGLDLADVKTFLDEIPNVPKSAYEDLEMMENEPPLQFGPKSDKILMPLFQQPGGLATFLDQVREKQVSLENAAVTDVINQTITGSVRVRNLDFHKSVHIRYTLDGWRSFADLQANYVPNSCDGFSDKFTFTIFGNTLSVGQRLELAVRFQCKGQQYWDNNYGANYVFQCLPTITNPAVTPTHVLPSHHTAISTGIISPVVGDAWCSSFY